MSRYLDPKVDVVFKKIFGHHPDLLKSFLNALLPLPADAQIETLEYLPNEEVPMIPVFKNSLVDVKCKDTKGRFFIVEMQVQWTTSFMQRMLFNMGKAYVRQLEKGEDYHLLKPVYGLGLINGVFDNNSVDWYHHYKMVNVEKPEREIKDLQLVFIELPKFEAKTFSEKKLQVLWLRFMSELNGDTTYVPGELLEVPEIKEALFLAEEAAYSPAELESYEKYWDLISIENTLMNSSKAEGHKQGLEEGHKQGLEEGHKQGLEEGHKQGLEEGHKQEKINIACNLLTTGMEKSQVAAITGLSLAELEDL